MRCDSAQHASPSVAFHRPRFTAGVLSPFQ
jgi:hypothetical protein